jgi:hypothetical protein
LVAVDPMTVDFPYARTLLAVQSTRSFPRTGQNSVQTRYFLSSLEPPERRPAQWIALVRGHWGGIENRNHWRRDALQGEDRTRTRDPVILINLALIRSACARVRNTHDPNGSLPLFKEQCAARPALALRLLHRE